MNKFMISKIWTDNFLSLQQFCSKIFGTAFSSPNKYVEQKFDVNTTNNINNNIDNLSRVNVIFDDNSNKNDLIKTAKENISNGQILPPIIINDIEDEYEDTEDFFQDDIETLPNSLIQPFDKEIIKPLNDEIVKPIDNSILKFHLQSAIIVDNDNIIIDDYDEFDVSNQQDINDINDDIIKISKDINEINKDLNELNDEYDENITKYSNESTNIINSQIENNYSEDDNLVNSVNEQLIDSINYDLLNLQLTSEIINDFADEYGGFDYSNEYGIYDSECLIIDDNDDELIHHDDNVKIPENIYTTKLDDIKRPIENIFLKNHHQAINVYDIENYYDNDDDDFLENENDDIINQMKSLIQPNINDQKLIKINDIIPIQLNKKDLIESNGLETIESIKDVIISPIRKLGILHNHIPPVKIGGDDYDQLLDDDPDDEEVIKRIGEYQSHGIKVFIPENKMPPGTIRYQLDKIPDGMPDDIRVIHYD